MRFLLVLSLLLLLVACGKAPEDTAQNITDAFIKGCAFRPSPGTVSAIIAAWDLKAGTAAAVIEGIVDQACTALKAAPGYAKAMTVAIKSPKGEVKIEGEFTEDRKGETPAPAPVPEPTPAWKPDPNCPGCESAPAPSELKEHREPHPDVQPGPPSPPKFGEPKAQ